MKISRLDHFVLTVASIERTVEKLAEHSMYAGDPQALASALDKIHRYASGIPFPAAEAHPSTAQIMIMNPLASGGIANLSSTHPATEERVRKFLSASGRSPSDVVGVVPTRAEL